MKEQNRKSGLKPIEVYIKEVYELAEKTETMEIIKMPKLNNTTKKNITSKNSTKKNKSKSK